MYLLFLFSLYIMMWANCTNHRQLSETTDRFSQFSALQGPSKFRALKKSARRVVNCPPAKAIPSDLDWQNKIYIRRKKNYSNIMIKNGVLKKYKASRSLYRPHCWGEWRWESQAISSHIQREGYLFLQFWIFVWGLSFVARFTGGIVIMRFWFWCHDPCDSMQSACWRENTKE